MLIPSALIFASLSVAVPPTTRVAVLLDDAAQGKPAVAAIERTLQKLGYEVVAPEIAQKIRKVAAPRDLLERRLPEGLSVFETDAIIAGAVSYGDATDFEGIKSLPVSITARLIDLGTGKAAATLQADGVGIGAGGPALKQRGTAKAVKLLFEKRGLSKALSEVGSAGSSVLLIVRGLPSREALSSLKMGLEKALAGAPIRELYYAKGLGKLRLGGSKAPNMVGSDIADLLTQHKNLALRVEEVANTRILAFWDLSKTIKIHALVLEPRLPQKHQKKATELGKYVATQMATFDFARASYQRGQMPRKQALKQAQSMGAQVVVESEVLGDKNSSVLVIRVIDAASGRPILRQQKVLKDGEAQFGTAEALMAELKTQLPQKLLAQQAGLDPKKESKPARAAN